MTLNRCPKLQLKHYYPKNLGFCVSFKVDSKKPEENLSPLGRGLSLHQLILCTWGAAVHPWRWTLGAGSALTCKGGIANGINVRGL